MQERLVVELMRMFIRLRKDRFTSMSEGALGDDSPGWQRGHGEETQWLIRPGIWRNIFEPHDIDPIEAARTLSELGLLHGQSNDTLQCVVQIGRPPKSVRAYGVHAGALASWRPPTQPNYRGYRHAGVGQGEGAPPSSAVPTSEPSDLSSMLERGVSLALQKGLEVLSMSIDPTDRQCAGLLRAQTALAGHIINAQVRVDEGRLRQKKVDAIERVTRLIEEERERQRRLGY